MKKLIIVFAVALLMLSGCAHHMDMIRENAKHSFEARNEARNLREVYVDGFKVGNAPVIVGFQVGKTYTVELRRPPYLEINGKVNDTFDPIIRVVTIPAGVEDVLISTCRYGYTLIFRDVESGLMYTKLLYDDYNYIPSDEPDVNEPEENN